MTTTTDIKRFNSMDIDQNNRAASDRPESTRDVAAAPVDFVVMRRLRS